VRPLRDIAASVASEAGLSSAQVCAVKFCVGEVVANAVKHAYPEGESGPVEVDAHEVGGELAFVVADHGSGRAQVAKRLDEGGFGLAFMSRLTDGCTFTAGSDGTTVEMLFPLPGGKIRVARGILSAPASAAGWLPERRFSGSRFALRP